MTEPKPITRSPDGLLHCLTLWGCRCSILAHVLNPEVPFIWLHRHLPQEPIAWWKVEVPLRPGGRSYELEVREMRFDAQMSTGRFFELLPEFEESGIDLFQISRKVPNTLRFRPQDGSMNRILLDNGLFLKFYLPHADEVAMLCSPDESYLEDLLAIPAVRELAR